MLGSNQLNIEGFIGFVVLFKRWNNERLACVLPNKEDYDNHQRQNKALIDVFNATLC